jgi:rhodanese-related sulfurtransferase
MSQLLQFATNHPFLVSAAVLMLLLVVFYEVRAASQSKGAIAPAEAVRLMNQGAVLIDIRDKAAFDAGHIAGAKNVPGAAIADGAKALEKYKEKPVIAYCDSGSTAGAAVRQLLRLGFKQPMNLRGGLAAWRADNLPVVKA